MKPKKTNIEESFEEFANQQEMYLNPIHNETHYRSLSGAIKALKILQMIIGGEMQKRQRVLRTHTTDYTIESSEGDIKIHERIRDEFIVKRIKGAFGIVGKI